MKMMRVFLSLLVVGMLTVDVNGFGWANITASEWDCFEAVLLNYPDGTIVNCGTEVSQNASQTFPNLSFLSADPATYYTVIFVGRNSQEAGPQRIAAYGSVPGSVVAAGLNSVTLGTQGLVTLTKFSAPAPVAYCVSYYVMLYKQESVASPPAFPNDSPAANWDFPTWASQNKLQKVGETYLQTQASSTRTAACPTAPLFNSLNVSESDWKCDGLLGTTFIDKTTVNCGTEVLQNVSGVVAPVLKYPSATATGLYTLVMLDRDGITPATPILSPIRHAVFGNIPGSMLVNGFTPSRANIGGGVMMLSTYIVPQPPPGTGCHRYYFILYSQSNGKNPAVFMSSPLTWDFAKWASQNQLTKVATNYFQTQNLQSRTDACPVVSAAFGISSPLFLTLLCVLLSTFITSSLIH